MENKTGFPQKYSIEKRYLTPFTKRRCGSLISGPGVKFVVAHDTGNPGSTAPGNVSYYQSTVNEFSASAHIFCDDTKIIECVPALMAPPEKAWHVLKSSPLDNALFGVNANDGAIGVELCYGGRIDGCKAYERYVWVIAFICRRFNLDPGACVIGHHILDPKRKTDPQSGLRAIGKSYSGLLLDIPEEFKRSRLRD
jgi:N-acetylmuramoyl-L-alanine amidase